MPADHPNDQFLEYVLPATFIRIGEEWGVCVETGQDARPEPGMLCRVKRKDGTVRYVHVKEVNRRVSFGWKCTFKDPSSNKAHDAAEYAADRGLDDTGAAYPDGFDDDDIPF